MVDQNPGAVRPDRNTPLATTGAGGAMRSRSGTVPSKLGEAAQQAGSQVKEKAGALAAEAGEKAKGFLGNQIDAGADFLGHIGRSATAAAESLEAEAPQLAGFVHDLATSVSELSDTVRGQPPEALLETASTYVRKNPGLVLSAAAVCGFALTRLLQGGTWDGSRRKGPPGGSTAATSRSDAL
jgi:ElaB/YqjD/DUF883 family membrane-anchored ribosome-binding protein